MGEYGRKMKAVLIAAMFQLLWFCSVSTSECVCMRPRPRSNDTSCRKTSGRPSRATKPQPSPRIPAPATSRTTDSTEEVGYARLLLVIITTSREQPKSAPYLRLKKTRKPLFPQLETTKALKKLKIEKKISEFF